MSCYEDVIDMNGTRMAGTECVAISFAERQATPTAVHQFRGKATNIHPSSDNCKGISSKLELVGA
jgi:hypothetical protein